MRTIKKYNLQKQFNSFDDFCQFIIENIKNINIKNFIMDLEILYNSNLELFTAKGSLLKEISKILSISGRRSNIIYWKSRRWDDYEEKYKLSQSKGIETLKKNNVYENRYSLEWFINRYGNEGKEKYKKHHEYRASKLTNKAHLEKHGEEYVKNLNFLKSGRIEKFIFLYGEEEGIKKYNEFTKKCSTWTEQHFIEKYGEEGKKKWKNAVKLHTLNRKKTGLKNYNHNPSIGKTEKNLLDKYERENNIILQRQKKIGCYFVDGFDEQSSTIIEVFERHHLTLTKQINRDKRRMNFFRKRFNYNIIIIIDETNSYLKSKLEYLDDLRNYASRLYYTDLNSNLNLII